MQKITADPFLHVEMDAFLHMLPEACVGDPDGISFETVQHAGKPEVVIRTGPVAERAFRGMRHANAVRDADKTGIRIVAGRGRRRHIDEALLVITVPMVLKAVCMLLPSVL